GYGIRRRSLCLPFDQSRLPVGMTSLLASAIRLALPLLNIQLSKIDATSRLPLGARLESARPRRVLSAPSLIPESHRDRHESIECCHFAVALMSVCCRFAVGLLSFLSSYQAPDHFWIWARTSRASDTESWIMLVSLGEGLTASPLKRIAAM